ncbi:hypothetical protein [Aliikangiella sp. IMCC44359]|uniref:hypothetical protein n=1 Tax=Aliikangiella sp. IMCC44359 TaxID=3459125 RepID=UPI00403B19A5
MTDEKQQLQNAYQNTQQILKEQVVPQRALPILHKPSMNDLREANEYQSAGILMRRLADTITQWREQLPEDEEPAILAVMYGGIQISVERLAQESFHGIRIEGNMNGSPCMLLAHQSTVQMLCFVKKVEKKTVKRRIGFIIDGEEEEV